MRGSNDGSTAATIKREQQQHMPLSPEVARELEQELVEHNREERIQIAAERQRINRDKKLQEHRQRSSSMEERNADNANKSKTKKATFNPMSKFLSVFSVEPKHPDHKRSLTDTNIADGEEIKQPSEKKFRKNESTDSLGDADAADADDNEWSSSGGGGGGRLTPTTVSVMVVVAAVAVGLFLRHKK